MISLFVIRGIEAILQKHEAIKNRVNFNYSQQISLWRSFPSSL